MLLQRKHDYELKVEQVPAHEALVSRKRHFLRAYMGTGKTVIGTKAAYDVGAKRILIICPSNAIRTWEDHICDWYDGLDAKHGKDTSFNIHRWRKKYNNRDQRRKLLGHVDRNSDVNVWIMTAGGFLQDYDILTHKFDLIIIDEAKRVGLYNRKSKLFERLKPFARDAEYFWPMSGSPGRTPDLFWTIFHLFEPKVFASYHRFVNTYCYTQPAHWGGIEILGLKNEEGWYQLLDRKTTALTKKDLGHRETVRSPLYVELDKCQEEHYASMSKDMLTMTEDGNLIIAQTSMTQSLRLRQLLACPRILDPSFSMGGAFDDFVETIKESNPHTVLFTPFVEAIDHFANALKHLGYATFKFSGQEGLSPDGLTSRISDWRRSKGIAICSIKYATSFSFEPASECYFIGYEWDPDDNAQAEERINRLTTPYQCNAYYYLYSGTYDESQMGTVNIKQKQANKTLNTM